MFVFLSSSSPVYLPAIQSVSSLVVNRVQSFVVKDAHHGAEEVVVAVVAVVAVVVREGGQRGIWYAYASVGLVVLLLSSSPPSILVLLLAILLLPRE